MAVTTNPHTGIQNQDDGVLSASITSSATSLTISPIRKWVNGVYTRGGFDSTKGFAKLIDSTGKYEFISFDTTSVDSSYITTLSGIRRGLSVTASGYTAGTGIAFDANTRIYVCDYATLWQNLVDTDTTQTITGVKTFSGGTFTYPRITTITSSATPTINTDNCDAVTITALALAITSMTTNLSGTPVNFQRLIIRMKDDGTGRAITWGASFEAKGVALPTTTTSSKVTTTTFLYDTVSLKWGCIASVTES